MKLKNPKVGDIAVMNELKDAAHFVITKIEGFAVWLADRDLAEKFGLDKVEHQRSDTSLLFKPHA